MMNVPGMLSINLRGIFALDMDNNGCEVVYFWQLIVLGSRVASSETVVTSRRHIEKSGAFRNIV